MRKKKSNEELKNIFNLVGKTAMITGASGALGSAVSKGLALQGVNIALCDLDINKLDRLADEIRQLGVKALPVVCDVTVEQTCNEMVQAVVSQFGGIDILFNGAGAAHREALVDMEIDDWQRIMDINVKGSLICCKAVAKEMIRTGRGGNIINIGSVRGFHGHADGYTAYGTSKAAIHYLTKTLAFEWAKHNIRVNCIAPCVFWSPLTEPILSDEAGYKGYTSRIPLGRAAEPEDFVGPTIFLASEASAMVTAHILSVDGGTVGG